MPAWTIANKLGTSHADKSMRSIGAASSITLRGLGRLEPCCHTRRSSRVCCSAVCWGMDFTHEASCNFSAAAEELLAYSWPTAASLMEMACCRLDAAGCGCVPLVVLRPARSTAVQAPPHGLTVQGAGIASIYCCFANMLSRPDSVCQVSAEQACKPSVELDRLGEPVHIDMNSGALELNVLQLMLHKMLIFHQSIHS